MFIGGYRHRITLQQQTLVRNSSDEKVPTWVDWRTVWAMIRPVRGQEFFRAAQLNAEIDGIIRIRHIPGLLSNMRIRYKGRTLQIVAIRNIHERGQEIEIMYKETG